MRKIFRAIGLAVTVALIGFAIYSYETSPPSMMPQRALFKQAFSAYSDTAPMIVCNDLRGNCRRVADDLTDTQKPPLFSFPLPQTAPVVPPIPKPLMANYADAVMSWLAPVI